LEDDCDISADLSITKNGSDYYAVLTMNKDMVNYLDDRFLSVKLDFNSEDGLKVPLTSIVDKDCYKIPLKYLTQGADSQKKGITKVTYDEATGSETYTFVPAEIYNQDEEYIYIDAGLFDSGTWIVVPSNGKKAVKPEKYQVKDIVKLKGVYNVNQGYAIFKRIEILYQKENYCIISRDTANGLSAYDHIALVGKTAVDQQIIY
jgi:hypothetical protein